MQYEILDIRDFSSEYFDEKLDMLPLTLQKSIQQFKNQNDQYTRILAYTTLAKLLKIDPINLIFERLEHGKPYLYTVIPAEAGIHDKNVNFNISHTKNYILVAVSDSEIGVDIEELPDFSMLDLKNVFTENEIENQTEQYLLKIWTMKESYLKCRGIGLTGLDTINITNLSELDILTNLPANYKI
ncbi:MAG: 4'-phosphopantetheinyl transferase superfamily protein, partial [Bifidobacteriaceae bacterium]|nr:4'-phosphopantetheinyl transferase superfamily protein [Bifidobacteriaceae bacterium]